MLRPSPYWLDCMLRPSPYWLDCMLRPSSQVAQAALEQHLVAYTTTMGFEHMQASLGTYDARALVAHLEGGVEIARKELEHKMSLSVDNLCA
jgi:hypothetical protein